MQANKDNSRSPFAEVLAEILQLQDAGYSPSREKFIERFPEYRSELSVYFDNMAMVETISDAKDSETHADRIEKTLAGPDNKSEPDTSVSTGFGKAAQNETKDHYPVFTRYEILDTLGQGAMGAVYLARDRVLDRKVALKVPLLPENSPKALNRFLREAKTAASLQHRNICPLFDIGEENGQVFITMAYVKGKPLSNYVKSGKPISQLAVAKTIRKLAIALHEAHENGVVHRDLKPANVMVDAKGEPIVMDFGLARQENLPNADQLTQSGMILGTPAYMSPEQIQDSGGAGPSADIYSLGVMMYQMLTGSLPFTGEMMSVISKILTVQPPLPSALRENIDPELETICLAAMKKDPNARLNSMQEFANRLTIYLRQARASGRSSEPFTRSEIEKPSATIAKQAAGIDAEASSATEFSISDSVSLANSTSSKETAAQIATGIIKEPMLANATTLKRIWLTVFASGILGGLVLTLATKHGFKQHD